MSYGPIVHRRRSIRLPGYDYTQAGAYFVTFCTRHQECLLGDPILMGITHDVWRALPGWFPTIVLDEFVVMPNHVHLIVWLHANDPGGAGLVAAPGPAAGDGAGASPAPTGDWVVAPPVGAAAKAAATPWTIPLPEECDRNPTLGQVIGAFKSLVFAVYLDWLQANDPARLAKFWQRNYFEHIIREDGELEAIRWYIHDNPVRWDWDRDNPNNLRHLPPPRRVEDYLTDIQDWLSGLKASS